MANSPLVSLRIPAETLERLDEVAQQFYPSRRAGKNPNRSQVILDAIAQFLEQHEVQATTEPNTDEQMKQILKQYQKHLEQQIKEYIDEKFLAYAYNLEQRIYPSRKVIKHL